MAANLFHLFWHFALGSVKMLSPVQPVADSSCITSAHPWHCPGSCRGPALTGRAGDRRRDSLAAGACLPALHHQHPCKVAGSPGGEGTAASWDPLVLILPAGFGASSQMCAWVAAAPAAGAVPGLQQGHGRQGPSQCLTALSLCPVVA